MADRWDEIGTRLAEVRDRVRSAAESAGRRASDVTLVVITKTFPTSDIRILHDLGIRDVGENRHPEAEDKAHELADLDLRWHFVGQVQTNKARRISAYADVVHSVDSVRLVHRLNSGAHQHDRTLDCLLQISLDPEAARDGRGGVSPDDVEELAAAVDTAGGLRLRGVMGVAPLGGDAAAAYRELARVFADLSSVYPGLDMISAGMSADFIEAIAAGATHVRVGSAILGERPPNR